MTPPRDASPFAGRFARQRRKALRRNSPKKVSLERLTYRLIRKRNLQHFEPQRAHRHLDISNLADLLAKESLAYGARRQNLVVIVIFLARPNDDKNLFLIE